MNWREFLAELYPDRPQTFDQFLVQLKEHYAFATPEAAEAECGVDAQRIRRIACEIGRAGSAVATHVWRNAAAGNLGGWQVARCLQLLVVLTGAVGTKGGTHLNTESKFVPPPFLTPPPQRVWNELLYPAEYPLAHHELSYLLPHFLSEGRGRIAAYFTRVYNPLWTNPDGLMWERVLKDESLIELHAALTPVWSETAQYADYVLPMGLGAERHDLMSQETHAAKWISFRQPVVRVAMERLGKSVERTSDANPGEVWEEDEFWIELSWRIDPDGSLGIRKYYESPYRPGRKITIDEYYRWIFANSVPGLPEEAARHDLTPLQYMRRFGAFLVEAETYEGHMTPLAEAGETAADSTVIQEGRPIGVVAAGRPASALPRRHAGSRSTARLWRSGAGQSTPCPAISGATFTEPRLTGKGGSSSWYRPFACPRSSTRAPPTPSGSASFRTQIPCGFTQPTPTGSGSRPAAWCG